MTVLMVTPYAPYRDGIANYAVQEVAALRRTGVDVEVLSPLPSAAHHHLALGSPRGWWALARRAASYDRIVVQVYPELLVGGCRFGPEHTLVWLALLAIARRTSVELRIHELDYRDLVARPRTLRIATMALAAVDRLTVHTAAERSDLLATATGPIGEVELIEHGKDFVARTTVDRADARQSLGIPADAFVFVSIGFVQRHKGFDRAIRAFQQLAEGPARLYVVGDVRIDHPDLAAYRDELDRLCRSTPGCERRTGYVSDEEFDRWIVAADRVVLPYREIWSSSVVERAALLDCPVIVTPVGGLGDQARSDTVVVQDDAELAAAMAAAAGVDVRPVVIEAGADRAELEALIHQRAHGGATPEELQLPITAAIRHHGVTALGAADSARVPVRAVKRVIRKLTAWYLDPLVQDVNEHILAADQAIESLECELRRRPERAQPD